MSELSPDVLYELVTEAVRDALGDQGESLALSKRMVGGTVVFRDAEGRVAKEVDASVFFKKVTAVREKLRVLEQRVNKHEALDHADRAELQSYLTKCYGTLTTFNFLFRDDDDRFKGAGG
jgi:hypothetical protein